MADKNAQAAGEPDIDLRDEATIISYLRNNPDFFLRNKSLLTELQLPHESGSSISLVERQVAILRERNVETRRRLNELLTTANANEELFRKTRVMTLALLECQSLQELNEVLATHILVDFDADFVCAHLNHMQCSLDHIASHDKIPFNQLLRGTQPVCTSLRADELQQIFPLGEHGASGSAVLLPLFVTDDPGLLAIGSRDANHFSGQMDTLFVTYIADVLTKVLKRL
ncbi:MAG: DUF484 family protein [Pseudomonadota bacterium]